MRLLKTTTDSGVLELHSFYDQDLPKYSILSHYWSNNPEDEVLYSDIVAGVARSKPGYSKVLAALQQAQLDGYEYCWVDTCCIDKTSSSELSEAINSMYRWYGGAEKCYAFLEDVKTRVSGILSTDQFAKSKWWRRGWTLQELLAPPNVSFFGYEWRDLRNPKRTGSFFGTKHSLKSTISKITGIDVGILEGRRSISTASICQRMSWAAHRVTSRLEDEAYCLMGIFDVHMPMLYGEGSKAFLRLQEEILKRSDDESIFAWRLPEGSDVDGYHGLLADSPKAFAESGRILEYNHTNVLHYRGDKFDTSPWSMTNRGLNLELPLQNYDKDPDQLIKIATLGCAHLDSVGFLGISLKPIGRNQYVRVNCHKFEVVFNQGTREQLFVPQAFIPSDDQELPTRYAFHLRSVKRGAGKSRQTDFYVEDAVFRNDERPFLENSALRWIESSRRSDEVKHEHMLAAFLIQSEYYETQFVLMLAAESNEKGAALYFDVALETFGSPIGNILSYESKFQPLSAQRGWRKLSNAQRIAGIKLSATPQHLPGGVCFWIDVRVYTKPGRTDSASGEGLWIPVRDGRPGHED